MVLGVVGGVVALALAIGAVVVLTGDDGKDDEAKTGGTTSGQNGGPSTDDPEKKGNENEGKDGLALSTSTFQLEPDRTTLWKAKTAADTSPSSSTGLVGNWLSGNNFILGDEQSITAYDLKTGEKAWDVEAPESNAVPCYMSDEITSDGKAAVLFRKASAESFHPCTLLTIIDTKTGRPVWFKDVKPGAEDGDYGDVAIDEKNNRVFAITAEMVFSYSLDAGKKNWDAGGKEYCNITGEATPTAVLVEQTCFDSDKTVIHSLDLNNGRKSLWTYSAPGDSQTKVSILSAAPAVALVNEGSAAARGNIVAFDAKGKPGRQIPMAQAFGNLPDRTSVLGRLPRYYFTGTTMVTAVGKGSSGKSATVAAFDLTTGAEKWHQDIGTAEKGAQILAVNDTSVVAAKEGGYDTSGKLVSIALDSGKQTEGGSFPSGSSVMTSLDFNQLVLKGDLIFGVEAYASSYNPRVVAFGPK
ncbi:hypothetical protein AQ490_03835 [Wenjunlia vitaminophila]|uniref:Pyrrolo-quinoline quinone repeat domain-containing protein n=1 Tax=Wenjunlia vitaminophila TaxID=76728 RepID=A0A0T6LTU2_WENVI|nr:hypothetical protein AQ490_03835 [Wenjunlia vitaminophila]